MAAPDYYQILEISPSADAEEVRAAYERLAGLYGRRKNGRRAARWESITKAYEVLGDPQQRAAYDRVRRLLAQRRRAFSRVAPTLNWALWLLPLVALAIASLAIFWAFPSQIPSPVATKADTAVSPRPQLAAPTPTAPPKVLIQPTKAPTPAPTKGPPSREACLDAIKKDGLEAFRMGCDAVLELGVLKAALEEASAARLEQLFADLESRGVTARTHADVGKILDAWIEASEKLRNAQTREEVQASYRGMVTEEQKLVSLRDALRGGQ